MSTPTNLDAEAKFLLQNGIKYIYNTTHYNKNSKYLQVEKLNFPLTSGKIVYLIASGTNTAYILPYYILMMQEWFKNALNENQYKSALIHTHSDNIILTVEPPNPGMLNYLVEKLSRGRIGYYIDDKDTVAIKELLDYFCIGTINTN